MKIEREFANAVGEVAFLYVCVCVCVLIGVPRTRGNFDRFHSQTVAVAKEIRVISVTNDRHVINRLLVSLRLKYAKCHSVLSHQTAGLIQ